MRRSHDRPARRPPARAARRAACDERAAALLPLGTRDSRTRTTARDAERAALAELTERLRNTYPYPDPRYAGQMLKPPAAIAWAAYATAMLLNPNNHALDGGPATAEMEKEAVAQLAAMFGLPQHLGHLTASGTIANLEALWVARELHPDARRSCRARTPTTPTRGCAPCSARATRPSPEDDRGRIDLDALAARLRARRRRHRGRDAGHDRRSARSTTSRRSPRCAPSTARGCTSTRPTAASSR